MNTTTNTIRKNHGPFRTIERSRRAITKFNGKGATLRCEQQIGSTPMGRQYRMPRRWWIKLDGSPCAMGPWTAAGLREHYLA